jgi:hypothetical protein
MMWTAPSVKENHQQHALAHINLFYSKKHVGADRSVRLGFEPAAMAYTPAAPVPTTALSLFEAWNYCTDM